MKRTDAGPDKDPETPTHFGQPQVPVGGPFVDPRITDPQAMAYAQRLSERRGGLPKYTEAVAGGPAPPIPNLGGEAMLGVPMAAQAAAMRPSVATGGIIQGGLPQPFMGKPSGAPKGLSLPPGILPGDVLTEEATKDPAFRSGAGSMVAASQPALAYKYGVIRKDQRVAPQQLRSPSQGKQLSPETLEGLKQVEAFQKMRADAEGANTENLVARQAAAGPAGKSSETEGGTPAKMTEEEKKEILDQIDDLDLNKMRNIMMRDLLNNEEQKRIIEARLKPLNITQLIVEGRTTQVVPVRPGEFEPEYQSYNGEEDLIIKRLIANEAKSLVLDERYFLDKYSLMGLTVSVRSINKVIFPTHEDEEGNFNEDLFWKKYDRVAKLPYHLLSSLYANWFWFDMRVRKLFVAEELGNG